MLTLLATPLVIRLAHHYDWLAYPREDRWHATPTALMGGIALVGGAFGAAIFSGALVELPLLWLGGGLLFAVGLYDDWMGVQPAGKLAVQIAATALLIADGYMFGSGWHWLIAGPLTLLWVVGITNAINLLDNMDGLSAGIAGIAAVVLLAVSGVTELMALAATMAAVMGAALGFLLFNFKPARIFMGDCGSLFLGFMLAAGALGVQNEASINAPVALTLLPLAVLAVPILDTTLVTLVRRWAGRSISKGGRDHTSHRLVFMGLSEAQAVLTLYTVSAVCGALALAVLYVDTLLFYALSAFVSVALIVFGIYLARANVYDDEVGVNTGDGMALPDTSESSGHVLYRLFGHRWKAVFGVFADSALLAAAFIVAHYLRFEGGLTSVHEERMLQALPLIVAAKVAIFTGMGMYRAIWRHAGTPEIVRTIAASAVASVAGAAVWAGLFSWSTFSVSVWFIDLLVATLAVVGVRFGFRGMRQYFLAQSTAGKRVLIYGASDSGALLLREIRQNPELDYDPIGFVDDDPMRQGQRVQGIPVLGNGNKLPDLCARYDIDLLIVSPRAMTDAERAQAQAACAAVDIPCRVFAMRLAPARGTSASLDISEPSSISS